MTFKTLFELTFEHEYFGQKKEGPFLKFGSAILNTSGIKIRDIGNKIIAYAAENEDFSNLSSVCFSIEFLDPNFFNYTDINFDSSKLLYFSNRIALDDNISSNDALRLSVFPKKFVFPSRENFKTSTRNINDLTFPNIKFEENSSFDLTEKTSGAYQVELDVLNDNDNSYFPVFVSDEFYHRSPNAVFEWNIKEGESEIKKYTLTFKGRSTYWRYNIIGLSEAEWQETEILPTNINGEEIKFSKLSTPQTLPDGKEAYVLCSTKPISLRHIPDWKIMLKSKKFPEGLVLPNASPEQIRVFRSADDILTQGQIAEEVLSNDDSDELTTAYCSDIFVYI